MQVQNLLLGKNSKTGHGPSIRSVKSRRDAPYSTTPLAKFRMVLFVVFNDTVRWISNNSMNGIGRKVGNPLEHIGADVGRTFR